MPPTTGPYSIRPGFLADLPAAASLLCSAFAGDSLMDFLYPTRHDHPADFRTQVHRFFRTRYWTPGYFLTVIVDDANGGKPVGISWWRKPAGELSFYERWLSPYAWFAPIARAYISLTSYLFPLRSLQGDVAGAYQRVFATIEPGVLNTPRRREAWYLSTLAVEPSLQGHGLGTRLLDHGMAQAKAEGKALWLVGLDGVETFYGRLGFVEVARANVGELKEWKGGAVMFAE